jgi:hypothetical protein
LLLQYLPFDGFVLVIFCYLLFFFPEGFSLALFATGVAPLYRMFMGLPAGYQPFRPALSDRNLSKSGFTAFS